MASNSSLLATLTSQIASNAAILDEYLNKEGIKVDFDVNAPVDLKIEDRAVMKARMTLLDLSKKLGDLVRPVRDSVRVVGMDEIYLLGALYALANFNVFEWVPLEGDISIQELRDKTGIKEDILTRLLKKVEVHHYFKELRPGHVSHTAFSRVLATEPGYLYFLKLKVEMAMPSSGSIAKALKMYPQMDSPEHSPFCVAFGKSFFDYLDDNPNDREGFAKAMQAARTTENIEALASMYAWGECKRGVVDIGGGTGHISTAIAQRYPSINFLVEDLEGLKEEANRYIRAEGRSANVKFLTHNMFEPQPLEACGASAYMLGNILHDWPETSCRRIIRNIVDAMEPDSKILIGEYCLRSGHSSDADEQQETRQRTIDMSMLALLNGAQRTVEGWEQLCQSVDGRLYVSKVVGPPAVQRHLLEISLA